MGALLGCLIEARDEWDCVCLGASLGRGRGRSSGGAGRGNSCSIGPRGFRFARVGSIKLDDVLLNPACALGELGQCGSRPEVGKLDVREVGSLLRNALTAGQELLLRSRVMLSSFHLAKNVSTVSLTFMMRGSMAAKAFPYLSESWKLSSSRRKADTTSSASGCPSSIAWFRMSAMIPGNLEAMYRTPDSGVGYRQRIILSF